MQALFFVPQVREYVASIELPNIPHNLERDSPGLSVHIPFEAHPNVLCVERAMWNLMEVFVNLDLAQLAAIVDSDALPSLMAQPLTDHGTVGDITAGKSILLHKTQFMLTYHCYVWVDFCKAIADIIEGNLKAQSDNEQ